MKAGIAVGARTRLADVTSTIASRLTPARVYAWVGGVSLLLLAFLTPPFEVPDEPQHFFRAYQLSTGAVWSRTQDGRKGWDLPASLPALVERFLGTNALHTARKATAQPLEATLAELQRPLDPGRTAFVAFNTGSYSPLQYAPQALAILGGRLFEVGPLGLFYFARLANALTAGLLTIMALREFAVGGRFALLVALLPMTQYMTASCNPDAIIIASALILTAIATRFLTEGTWSHARTAVLFVAGTALCSIKPVYVPVLFCGVAALLAPEAISARPIRRAVLCQLAAAALVFALTALWSWSVGTRGTPRTTEIMAHAPGGIDPQAQFVHLAQDPLKFLRIVARTFYFNGAFLWHSMVGQFGWLTIKLPASGYWLIGLAFPLAVVSKQLSSPISIAGIAWVSLLAACSLLMTSLALYLTWTEVGGYKIEGIQGRYFIPLLPLVGFGIAALLERVPLARLGDGPYLALVSILVGCVVITHATLIRAYSLF